MYPVCRHECSFHEHTVTATKDAIMADENSGAQLPFLPIERIRVRVGLAKWLWARELFVEELGTYR